jgi:hypothetical protein
MARVYLWSRRGPRPLATQPEPLRREKSTREEGKQCARASLDLISYSDTERTTRRPSKLFVRRVFTVHYSGCLAIAATNNPASVSVDDPLIAKMASTGRNAYRRVKVLGGSDVASPVLTESPTGSHSSLGRSQEGARDANSVYIYKFHSTWVFQLVAKTGRHWSRSPSRVVREGWRQSVSAPTTSGSGGLKSLWP